MTENTDGTCAKHIEKLPDFKIYSFHNNHKIVDKVNEIIDYLKGEQPSILVCPHCGSEEWEDRFMSTLMGGPRNYYTYTCIKCGKSTKVLRIKAPGDHRVYLGPEDEVQ